MKDNRSLEIMWERLLSRQPQQIKAAFESLAPDERQAVRNHLKRMSEEPGWHPEQRLSAQAALNTLGET